MSPSRKQFGFTSKSGNQVCSLLSQTFFFHILILLIESLCFVQCWPSHCENHKRRPRCLQPDIYGGSITVERRISKDGAAGYKIKAASGKTISTKREELTLICDHMSIQVDNPLTI